MDRDNRKSHLQPQLSPTTQELLRSSDEPTPTSGEIPILGTMVSPRDQHSSVPNRPPPRSRTDSAGRTGGPPIYPGLGARVATTGSQPRYPQQAPTPPPSEKRPSMSTGHSYTSSSSSTRSGFALPIRPGPPGQPMPPPPPRRQLTAEELQRESRRQAAMQQPPTGRF